MELMRKNAKKAKDPERMWNCKRLSALLRAFLKAQIHESCLCASFFRENIENELATEGTEITEKNNKTSLIQMDKTHEGSTRMPSWLLGVLGVLAVQVLFSLCSLCPLWQTACL